MSTDDLPSGCVTVDCREHDIPVYSSERLNSYIDLNPSKCNLNTSNMINLSITNIDDVVVDSSLPIAMKVNNNNGETIDNNNNNRIDDYENWSFHNIPVLVSNRQSDVFSNVCHANRNNDNLI